MMLQLQNSVSGSYNLLHVPILKMASGETTEKIVSFDKASFNELLYSIGRLKFSLRALSTLQVQALNVDIPESEPQSEDNYTHKSNKVLENVINEVVSERIAKDTSKLNEEKNKDHIISVDELTKVNKKLSGELENARQRYYDMFSKFTQQSA